MSMHLEHSTLLHHGGFDRGNRMIMLLGLVIAVHAMTLAARPQL